MVQLSLKFLAWSGLTAAVFLWASYSGWFFMDDNYRTVLAPVEVPSAAWQILEGEGEQSASRLLVRRPGSRAEALLVGTLPRPFAAEDLERIDVRFEQVGSSHSLAIGVSHSESYSRPRDASGRWVDGQTASVKARDLLLLDRPIQHVSIRIRGAIEPGFIIERAELHRARPGFFDFQKLLLSSLIDLSRWTQSSINQNESANSALELSPVPVVVAWMLLTLLLVAGTLTWRRRLDWKRLGLAGGAVFLLGWLLLDMGWQVSLWQRHFGTVQRYSGLSPEEKRETEVDGDVFEFIRELKARIADPMRPVVIFGDSDFSHYRARYFATPHPVISRREVDGSWLRRLRPDDILVSIHTHRRLESQPVEVETPVDASPRPLALSDIAGHHAQTVACPEDFGEAVCDTQVLKLREDERPWLVEAPGLDDLGFGIWQLELDLTGGQRAGWVRLEVFRRHEGDPERWAWREIYLAADQARTLSLAFRADERAKYRMRLRELDVQGVAVHGARLVPRSAGDDLVELSLDGDPPYFLARRVLESGGKFAWEVL